MSRLGQHTVHILYRYSTSCELRAASIPPWTPARASHARWMRAKSELLSGKMSTMPGAIIPPLPRRQRCPLTSSSRLLSSPSNCIKNPPSWIALHNYTLGGPHLIFPVARGRLTTTARTLTLRYTAHIARELLQEQQYGPNPEQTGQIDFCPS